MVARSMATNWMMTDPDEELEEILALFTGDRIARKVFFKRMAALGYQQAEALELAESWEDV